MDSKKLEQLKEKLREKNRKKYEESSLDRLKKIVATKMKTTFIGAISEVEEKFGFLWGHGKSEEEKTDTEKKLSELWALCRTEILNNGNNQLRAIKNELDTHTVVWNRYTINLDFRPKGQEEDFNG